MPKVDLNITIPDSIDNAIHNLTDKPTKSVADTFCNCWDLVFGYIGYAADKNRMKYKQKLETYEQELKSAINDIPSEKLQEPSIQVTAQALENSKYCLDSDELRAMFVNLISGTMNVDKNPLIHPSFPEMIKQMSPVEAFILCEFKTSSDPVPVVQFLEEANNDTRYRVYLTNVYISNYKHPTFTLDDYSCALTSLERMGLVNIAYNIHSVQDSVYDPFYELHSYKMFNAELNNRAHPDSHAKIKKGLCNITPLGRRFILTCVV